jgi:hypothetical protein
VPAQVPNKAGAPTSPADGDTHPAPATPPRSPWPAVDAAKIREALARAAASTRGSSPTPAMDFGAFVRQAVDRSPEVEHGLLAMGKFLRLDPVGKAIEKLEAAGESLQTRVATLEGGSGAPRNAKASRPTPAAKSRRGRRLRAAGLDCEGQMLTVLKEDPTTAVFAGRDWEKRLKKRFGEAEGFSRKTVEKTHLYKKQLRPAVVKAAASYGPSFEDDFLEHGLELWSRKPGRGDKRKDLTEKQALAGREFIATLQWGEIDAERRQADGRSDV